MKFSIGRLRSGLYRAARLLGDFQAIRRGRALQRVKNRFVWRHLGKIARLFTR